MLLAGRHAGSQAAVSVHELATHHTSYKNKNKNKNVLALSPRGSKAQNTELYTHEVAVQLTSTNNATYKYN